MRIKYINHACVLVELSGQIIYFDPYKIPKDAENADIILASHDHYDHYQVKSLKRVNKDGTKIFGPKSSKKIMKAATKGLEPFESIEVGKITIKAIPAYNPKKRFHPKKNNWLGYIVSDENIAIYHAGDTDYIPEMENLGAIDYAFLPVGDKYTMDFKEAIKAAQVIKPKNVIPIHHWDKPLDKFAEMMHDSAQDINVIVLANNEEYSI
ncbi:MAG: MBL fold metallo-hydrolase [Candidatus Lokiarchaeota archaeon]|nr:MBL fold metallo-hydrolase [Candidatus Lokiarchaeota archaeon]